MEPIFGFAEPHIYLEYTIAIMIVTDLLRYLVKGIDRRIKPRFQTLIVAVVLSIPGYILHMHDFDFFKALTSFAFAIIGYAFVWQPIKEKFFPKVKQTQQE